MVKDLGDMGRQHGDAIGNQNVDDDVEEGDAVTLNNDGSLSRADEGDTILGVLGREPHGSLNRAMIQVRGVVVAHVPASVQSGETLGSADTSGDRSGTSVDEDVESVGQIGHNEDAGFIALEDATDMYDDEKMGALVLLR